MKPRPFKYTYSAKAPTVHSQVLSGSPVKAPAAGAVKRIAVQRQYAGRSNAMTGTSPPGSDAITEYQSTPADDWTEAEPTPHRADPLLLVYRNDVRQFAGVNEKDACTEYSGTLPFQATSIYIEK